MFRGFTQGNAHGGAGRRRHGNGFQIDYHVPLGPARRGPFQKRAALRERSRAELRRDLAVVKSSVVYDYHIQMHM